MPQILITRPSFGNQQRGSTSTAVSSFSPHFILHARFVTAATVQFKTLCVPMVCMYVEFSYVETLRVEGEHSWKYFRGGRTRLGEFHEGMSWVHLVFLGIGTFHASLWGGGRAEKSYQSPRKVMENIFRVPRKFCLVININTRAFLPLSLLGVRTALRKYNGYLKAPAPYDLGGRVDWPGG